MAVKDAFEYEGWEEVRSRLATTGTRPCAGRKLCSNNWRQPGRSSSTSTRKVRYARHAPYLTDGRAGRASSGERQGAARCNSAAGGRSTRRKKHYFWENATLSESSMCVSKRSVAQVGHMRSNYM